MKKVGLIGWRGMVGSVLMSRMIEKNDFSKIDPVFLPPLKLVRKHRNLLLNLLARWKMPSISMH